MTTTPEEPGQGKDKDAVTGVETTGHEWDGIKELNNPAPRWWLWVFYITVIWAIGYWVVYPSWPTLTGEGERGGTPGTLGWTQYEQLKEQQAEIIARKSAYLKEFRQASFDKILRNPDLYAFAINGGKTAFKDNCATCHGTGGSGGDGYPNLNDDEWLWGGDIQTIYETLKYGVRANHENTHISQMPAFGDMLGRQEIADLTDYVVSLSQGQGKGSENGAALFAEHCAACHGADGKGDRSFGAPNLTDAVWLYDGGGSRDAIASQIRQPRHGMMPAWVDRLDDDTLRQLSVYVHSLGGGE